MANFGTFDGSDGEKFYITVHNPWYMFYIVVGKIRQKWYTETVSAVGRGSLEAVKSYLDPQNIFAAGNLFQQAKL